MKKLNNTLLQISHHCMGTGDEDLGTKLITNYFKLINEETELPRFIVFYNSGVKLICKDSPIIEFVKNLELNGVKLIACKTCLNHFNLIDEHEVGIAGTMLDIIELQNIADKVINL